MATQNAVPSSFAQFGYVLAMTERTLTTVLKRHLAERGVEPERWYALQLLTTRGPRLPRVALVDDLAEARALDAELARGVVERLEADGLVSGDAELELTPAGVALHASLREHVAIPRNRLLSEFDPADVETTIRTLAAIAERAKQDGSV